MLIMLKKLFVLGVTFGIIAVLVYSVFIRPWIFRMGATKAEVNMTMPGDEMVSSANYGYTQAITINAPRDLVWSYIVQMGYKRAGWYNLDFINRLTDKAYFYENGKSANRIIPELQKIKIGDKISFVPQLPAFDVTELKKDQYVILSANKEGKYFISWLYMLKEIDKNSTRLFVRWRSEEGKSSAEVVSRLLVTEPGGAGIQQPLNLKGIKVRAEAELLKKK